MNRSWWISMCLLMLVVGYFKSSTAPPVLETPTFVAFKSDVSLNIPAHHVHHLVTNSHFRVYAKCNKTPPAMEMERAPRKSSPTSDCDREIRGVVRENSRREKLVSFPCSSLDRAGLFDVFLHLYEVEMEIHLVSFRMTWPGVELRLHGSGEEFQVIVTEHSSESLCCPVLKMVDLMLEVYHSGPRTRFEGELKSPERLIHEELITRSFNNPLTKHTISPCIFSKPDLYTLKLVSINPPLLLNSTEYVVSNPSVVQLTTSLIGRCVDHVTVSVAGSHKCASSSDRIRMFAKTRRSEFNSEKIYLAERPIRDGRSQFDCELLEEIRADEVCWKYVSLGTDGSVCERGDHCQALNSERPEGGESHWSEWSDCGVEGVMVRVKKCCHLERSCFPAQFLTCREIHTDELQMNNFDDEQSNREINSLQEVDEISRCGETFTRRSGTIVGGCNCSGGGAWWLVRTPKHHTRLDLSFTFVSKSLLNRKSKITMRDGYALTTSDILFDSRHDGTSVLGKAPNVTVTTETGAVLIELKVDECNEGVSFVASYLATRRRLGSRENGDRDEKEEAVVWSEGDKITFAAMLGILLTTSALLCATFRKNEIT